MRHLAKNTICLMIISTFAVAYSMILTKWEVSIKNELDLSEELFMHCKSKDTDLGERTLKTDAEFRWDFKVNLWGTTLFWCYLRTPNGSEVTFDAFWVEKKTKFLRTKCDQNVCNWLARYDGVHLVDNSEHTRDLIHPWKPPKTN